MKRDIAKKAQQRKNDFGVEINGNKLRTPSKNREIIKSPSKNREVIKSSRPSTAQNQNDSAQIGGAKPTPKKIPKSNRPPIRKAPRPEWNNEIAGEEEK